MSKAYTIKHTKIGNSTGLRIPAEFYREHPQFSDADGWIEVISDTTAVIRIDRMPDDLEEEDDGLILRLFLDFATEQALKDRDLIPYTTAMSAIAKDLIVDVEVDDE